MANRNSPHHFPAVLAGLLIMLGNTVAHAEEPTIKVGSAMTVITPDRETPMAGYYHPRYATGVHDDLYARSLVLDDGTTRACMISLDLIGTSRELVVEARQLISKLHGIPADHIMISATHSHTGPIIGASKHAQALGAGRDSAKNYHASLPAKLADSVGKALASSQPVKISRAIGTERNLAFNRRFFMADGTVGWNPGKRNPKIVRVAGPVDESVPAVYVESLSGTPIATYVNFAMHLDTVGGSEISADYPFQLTKTLADARGKNHVTIFTMGTSGDVNHIDVSNDTPQKGHEEGARIGTRLAGNVLASYSNRQQVRPGKVQVRTALVKLPLPAVSKDEYSKSAEIVAKVTRDEKPAPPFMEQVSAFRNVDVFERASQPIEVEVQTITLGDELAWVALPGEIFVQLGIAIKDGSPFKQTMITSLGNGSIGYIPTRVAYSQGNYEVVSARCAEGSGEMLVDEAVRQLRAAFNSR